MLRKRWFWAAVLAQVLVLLGMMAMHGYTLATGRPILLKTAPVDPWDLFRGEYVVLRYEISQLEQGKVRMEGAPFRRGQQVWVTLQEGDPYWNATAVSARRPETGANEVVVRATVEWWTDGYNDAWRTEPTRVSLRYGMEQFYVPEGEGRRLEDRREDITVEVAVDSLGRAALRKVFVAGEEIRWR